MKAVILNLSSSLAPERFGPGVLLLIVVYLLRKFLVVLTLFDPDPHLLKISVGADLNSLRAFRGIVYSLEGVS